VILDCPFVELVMVIDWPESSALFLDEEERGGIGAFGRMDISLG